MFDDFEIFWGEFRTHRHFCAGGDVPPDVIDDGVVLSLGVGQPVMGDGDWGELAEEFLVGALGGGDEGRLGATGEDLGIVCTGGDEHFLVVAGADVVACGEHGATALALRGDLQFDVGVPDPIDVGDEAPEGERKDKRDRSEDQPAGRRQVAPDDEPAFEMGS